MPGLTNDFTQLPPEQKDRLLRFAGQALGARGGDINNVAAKLQANPALAMQLMERSGIGVANPISGASGDRAWEPDFASTVSRSLRDEASSSNNGQTPPMPPPRPKSAGTNQAQRSGSNSGPPLPPKRPSDLNNVPTPTPRPQFASDPAVARAGDADMGFGSLAAGGAGMIGAALLANKLRGALRDEPMATPTRNALPATMRPTGELTTMDELMGPPDHFKRTNQARVAGPEEPKQLTDQKTKDPEGYRKSQVPAQDASQGEEPSAPHRTQGKVTNELGYYDPNDPRNRSAEYNAATSEANAGPAPVDKGNAPPGREASDLATYDDVVSNKGEVTTTKPVHDPEGYRQSQVPDDQQEYRTEPEKPKQIEGPKKNKAARTRVRIKGTNVRFK